MYNDQYFTESMEGLAQVKDWFFGKCVDVGCGTKPVHQHVLTVDHNADRRYAYADIVHDCKDLSCFAPDTFDTIFSSHCIEDFENIPEVFRAWFTRLKIGGVMVLLLPDMENGRYPRVGDPAGNPSHRINVGPEYFRCLLIESGLDYAIEQIDTVPHDTTTFDLVVRRLK